VNAVLNAETIWRSCFDQCLGLNPFFFVGCVAFQVQPLLNNAKVYTYR
jgi:hypothetical protein